MLCSGELKSNKRKLQISYAAIIINEIHLYMNFEVVDLIPWLLFFGSNVLAKISAGGRAH